MKTRLKGILAALLLTLTAFGAAAQNAVLHSDRLESARKLYYNGAYYAAERAFYELSGEMEGFSSLERCEIEAYKVLCAVALDKVNATGLVETFCTKYPNAPQRAMVRSALANRYFKTGRYQEALDIYRTVSEEHIYRNGRDEYVFNKAYCSMRTGAYDDAEDGFGKLLNRRHTRFTTPATYYLGYVHYVKKEFKKAAPLFEKVGEGNSFSLMARYFAVESRFMTKDYSYAISRGVKLFDELDRDMQTNLARILSEAYYETEQPLMAQKYLDIYKAGGAELSRKDYYFSGIVAYNLNNYSGAIESFSQVLGEKDDLSQNAFYYSANSHLQNRNKLAALDCFKSASEMDFDPVIKEDAFFNFAKLSFDVNSDITPFSHYMETFPDSGKEDVINNYMAASFILAKDYRSAVEALIAIKKPSREASANLQKAAFFRGMQLVEGGGYRSAAGYFETAVSKGSNRQLRDLARYWLAECRYRDDRFADAIALGKQILGSGSFAEADEYPQAILNQGYAYFKNGDFQEAEETFKDYLELSHLDRDLARDARTRLGDSYFMQKKYADAAAAYEEIFTKDFTSEEVYPEYQAAMAYGLMGDDARKISILNQVVRNNRTAELYPLSLFELGRTYVRTGKDTEASECFYMLLGMKNDSTWYSRSMLELAMLNSNARRYDKAIDCYKSIIRNAPASPEVQDAVSGLESIYQIQNRPEEFLNYIAEIGMDDLKSDEEREDMIFAAAERVYLARNWSRATSSLQSFIAKYPLSAKTPVASLYLADCLKNTGRLEAASDAYRKLIKAANPSVAESASARFGAINFDLQRYDLAVEGYEKFAAKASTAENRLSAYTGLMRSHFRGQKYRDAIKDAQVLASLPGCSAALDREARYISAKSYRTVGERDEARALFAELASDGSDAYGAESTYLLALDAYDRGDFDAVDNLVMSFADSGTSQQYWLAKSFIVLGDSYADRGDTAQARATFESILQGYSPQGGSDDVVQQVEARLKLLNNESK